MDELIRYGDAVKALGEGRVGGYLVRFSTATDPDLSRDFFTKDTDFGVAFPSQTPVLYGHGRDEVLGLRRIGTGEMKMDEVGVWVDAQLDMRDQYERAIYQLAAKGKLGWSSGTASHLVSREAKGAAQHVKTWPLGLDASLTPIPCEPRNCAVSLKDAESLQPFSELSAGLLAGLPLDEHSESVLAAVKEITARFTDHAAMKAADGKKLSSLARTRLKSHSAALREAADSLDACADGQPEDADKLNDRFRLMDLERAALDLRGQALNVSYSAAAGVC